MVILVGFLALIVILALGSALAFAIAYPFALIAKATDDRIEGMLAVHRRLRL